MKKMKVLIFFVAIIFVTWQCHGARHQIYPLRMKIGLGSENSSDVSCLSWRLAVETNNIIEWSSIPDECIEYIEDYFEGEQYSSDCKVVCQQAYSYAQTLNITDQDIWVFDIDETALTNLQYYADHGFGTEPYNATAYDEWVELGQIPALPATLELYNKLVALGIKIVFLTGRSSSQETVTASNLKLVGYDTWEKFITKNSTIYSGTTALTYKSAERTKLVESGYNIIGNIGDQWSDLLGTNIGDRTFKLPDPMYYVS